MKTVCRILLALFLLVPLSFHAAGAAPAHASGKSRQNQDRKVFGAYVVQKMGEAFDSKRAVPYACSNKPAYVCQGLMVTAFESDDTYWMDPKTPKISLTYFRQDIATPLFGNAGLVLWPQVYLSQGGPIVGDDQPAFVPTYRCAYPTDGNTDTRSSSGCGAEILSGQIVPDTAPCATLGITTAQQWLDKYGRKEGSICGFGLNPADGSDRLGMEAMIQVAATLRNDYQPLLFPWNEVVMAPWPSYAPARIPLMAFFWLPDADANPGARQPRPEPPHESAAARRYQSLTTAQQQQKRYYDLTKIFVPIVEISEASANAVFTYSDADQAGGIPEIVTTMPQ